MTQYRKKLIEVALPLQAINAASAREKSIRHGHPSTLHLWWARRPLAAARAVIFSQIVDDPSSDPDMLAYDTADREAAIATARTALHDLIRELVLWESTTNEAVLDRARAEIARSIALDKLDSGEMTKETVFHDAKPFTPRGFGDETKTTLWDLRRRAAKPEAVRHFLAHHAPGFHDPFAGGGALPLEAQRLGLTSYASDLNPVAVLINKAMIEIPPKFAGQPPVNPEARKGLLGAPASSPALGKWRSRGYLPHFDQPGLIQSITFRLHDSVPTKVVEKWRRELNWVDGLDGTDPREVELRERIDKYEDAGHGECLLNDPRVAELVQNALLHFDGERYRLIAWSVMPNHVHALIETKEGHTLGDVVHSWKSFTAHEANKLLGRNGEFWAREYFDRYIRNQEHFNNALRYIEDNPVKAGLAKHARDWKWGSAGVQRAAGTAALPGYKGAQGLAEDVRYYGKWMRDEAEKRIGHLYPKVEVTAEMAKERPDLKPYVGRKLTVIAWLWARTVKSPNPAYSHVDVPLASTFMLSTKPGKEAYVEPVIEGDKYRFTVKMGKPRNIEAVKNGTKLSRGANFQCVMSKAPIAPEHIYGEAKAGRMGAKLMAIVAEGDRGRVYLAPTPEHEATALKAKPTWKPDLAMPDNPRWFSPPLYGLKTYGDLFTARQLVALTTFSDLVQEARERVLQDALRVWPGSAGVPAGQSAAETAALPGLSEQGQGPQAYADAVAVYLAFALDKVSDRGSSLGRWDPTPTQSGIINTFSRHALPMTWDYGESNPLGAASGNYVSGTELVAKALLSAASLAGGAAQQGDASTQSTSAGKLVSTDPPYYDNIGYADLSDFFYVWLRRSLQPVFPSLFATVAVPKAEELVATPYRHGSKEKAETFFLDGMTQAMHRLADQAYQGAPVTIYYAFKQAETKGDAGTSSTGWETFIDAVIRAGFGISGTWPMRTELGNRMIGSGTNALASSIVLVCRPRPTDAPSTTRGAFVRALQNEMPEALVQMQAANIAPVDLPQSCIGPGMAIFTRYKSVLNQDDSPMKVREALQLINESIDNFFSEQEADYDAATRFALSWFDQHGFNDGLFGEADNLARARNVSVQGVVQAGILRSGQGKVRLLRRDELPKDWEPRTDGQAPIWEALQQLVKTLEERGEGSTAELAAKLAPHQRTLARELAYRLYTTCERKKQASEARPYNALIASWPEIERLADNPKVTKAEKKDMFK
jgi:putative DNA methylase